MRRFGPGIARSSILVLGALAGCGGKPQITAVGDAAAMAGDAPRSEAAGADARVADVLGDVGVADTTGSAGATGDAGAADVDGGAADASGHLSAGCNVALTDDVPGTFVVHTLNVTGLADVYQPGGTFSSSSGSFDLTHRPYAVRLPADYDPAKPFAVTFEGGGCGNTATNFAAFPTSEFSIDAKHVNIEVALTYVTSCFDDGGPAIGNRTDSPEVPYFRAALADVEARFCVDTSRVFVAGNASGAWEAQLLGCAAADVVRGIATFSGGLRTGRPACKGPVAALLVANVNDQEYPLGPLAATDPLNIAHGSPGLLPERDDILARNGCVGTETTPWNPVFPACVTFTGCPAALPVVWCPILGSGQVPMSQGNVSYAPGGMAGFLSNLP